MKLIKTIAFFVWLIPTLHAQQFFKDANGKFGFKDASGKVITAGKYETFGETPEFSEGFAVVAVDIFDNPKYGFIDKTGKEVIPLKYDQAFNFSSGLARVMQPEGWCFINTTGKVAIDLQGKIAHDFYNGLAAVLSNGYWGFIDVTGKQVIPCKYDRVISDFFTDRAQVGLAGRDFYIDKNGNEVK